MCTDKSQSLKRLEMLLMLSYVYPKSVHHRIGLATSKLLPESTHSSNISALVYLTLQNEATVKLHYKSTSGTER